MSEEKKPDGWVVQLPDGSLRMQEDICDLMITDEITAKLYAQSYSGNKARPVKLVFLDEEV